MKKIISVIVLALGFISLSAQQVIEVKGQVTEPSGEPVMGAAVLIAGTNSGTVTDFDGFYTISVASNALLEFSSLGFETKVIAVNGATKLDVVLEQDTISLDESVVVGYSVQKKRDVLGAVSKVNGKELTKVPVSTVQQSLQGRVAGVEVTSQTGAPGAGVSVRVRGTSSISSSNEPLYIVDGVPVEGALNNLSPNDIESISVLKDASSAAIYGSRATNGVVLITTKTGKAGDATISYNMQAGVQTHGHLTKMANLEEYIAIYNEATAADNAASSIKRPLIEGSWIKDFPDVNHLEEIFQVAPVQSHELSVSGGTKEIQYLISGSIYDQKGIILNTGYKRYSVRSNVTAKPKSWLDLSLNVNGSYSDNNLVSSSGDGFGSSEGGSVVRYALFRTPAIPVKDANGNWVDLPSEYYGDPVYNSFFGDGYSPEGLAWNTDRSIKTKSLIATTYAMVKFSKNMFWKTTYGIDYRDAVTRVFNPTWGTTGRINATNSLNINGAQSFNWTLNSTFNHSLDLGEDHHINYLVGGEAIRSTGEGYGMNNSDFPNTDEKFLFIGKGTGEENSSQSVSASSLLSFFANFNYNYKNRYYVSAILREDGSSRFSKGNRWGTFGSVSAGWNMEEEEWLKGHETISKLKLRAGFGAIGNQNIGLYAFSDRMSTGAYYMFGTEAQKGYFQSTLANTDLKWETSNQFNVGVDMEFLEGQFGFTADGYYKVTDNMLVQEALPLSVGNAATPWVNNGSVLNTGVDLEFFWRKNWKDGGLDITLNGGYLHNEVLSLNSPILGARVDSGIYATKTAVGHPIGSFFLYQMDGIFQDEIDVMTSAYQGANVKPGDVRYVDIDGSNVIDSDDRVFCGSAIPKFNTGLNISGYWKGFDASVFFQGAFGQKIFSQVNYDIEGYYRGFNVTKRYIDEHWSPSNPSNTQPRASWSAKTNNVRASTRFLEDGSYVRLKNIQLGYTVKTPEAWNIKTLRVYIAASNLFTLTKYNGLDPEMTVSTNSASEGDRANGIDWGTYPVAKSYTFGVNLTF